MTSYCYIDFETRSEADIKKVGARLYAEHPSTEILCVAYTNPNCDNAVALLDELCGDCPMCNSLWTFADDEKVTFVAHNTGFERAVWEDLMVPLGFPPIPIERWKCTLAKCVAHGLPPALGQACAVLGLPTQKDDEGHKIMLKLSKPRRQTKKNTNKWWEYDDCPDDFEKLYSYCAQDVEAEMGLDKYLRDLSASETRIWQMDQRMNSRGVTIDIPAVEDALILIGEHDARTTREFSETVGCAPTQRTKVLEWVQNQGLSVTDLQGPTVEHAIATTPLGMLRDMLLLYGEANKTSLAKYPQMLARSNAQGIARENLAYHGAHTGRWAGRGIQFQNLPRPSVNIPICIDAIRGLDYDCFKFVYPDVSDALSSAIRGMVIPAPGHNLYVGDFASIEAIVLAWLAGQQNTLDAFAQGEDLYCLAASDIYARTITKANKAERQVGKTAVLALGYQGGIGAFANMCTAYGVDLGPIGPAIWQSASHEEAEAAERGYLLYCKRTGYAEQVGKDEAFTSDIIKQRWRASNESIVQYWYDLERTAIEAVETGAPVSCRGVRWFMHGVFLFCKLPSGRCLAFPFSKVEKTERGKKSMTVRVMYMGKWIRIGYYGGKWAENITQAVSRDIMCDAMVRIEEHGYALTLTVHDEIVAEHMQGSVEEFSELMADRESWSADIPIKVECWTGERYGK